MHINLHEIDRENFLIKEGIFCGQKAFLINPKHIGAKFTQKNKIFRSSIWSEEGELLSGGLPKFTNWLENPEHFPVPKSLNNANIVNKIDGSLGIFDFVNHEFSIRTRGTFSYKTLENYQDFDFLLDRYINVQSYVSCNPRHSFLFEITSPNQRIVLDYGDKPDMFLVGIIDKENYSLLTQNELDSIAKQIEVKRPEYFTYTHLEELISNIQERNDIEGCCLYSKNDQAIHKIKSFHYLKLHALKSELGSLEKVIDLYFVLHEPSYEGFYDYLEKHFDFELAKQCRGSISKICDAIKEVNKIIDGMKEFIAPLKTVSRKDAALKILSSYGKTNRASFCFKLLDGQDLDYEAKKKLLYQVIG